MKKIDECALNYAGWEFVDEYKKHIGEDPNFSAIVNHIKPLLRIVITKYLEEEDKNKQEIEDNLKEQA